jgi:segregation and condensation protein B
MSENSEDLKNSNLEKLNKQESDDLLNKNEDLENLKLKIEAILFSYGEWVSIKEILKILNIDSELIVKNILIELKNKFKEGFSFFIESEGDKFRMVLKPQFVDVVEELISNVEIPKKVLKVLAVIAYEGPISKTRLSEILGKSVKEEVDYLYKNKFVSYEKKGIGRFYKVTKKFYEYFNLEEGENLREKLGNMDKYLSDFSE